MNLMQLKYFCHAAETQNLSITAKCHFVPTSNISQAIKNLEHELGVELFDHYPNRIVLNETGKRFYRQIKGALDTLDEAKRNVTGTACSNE